jgi:LacI family transcriptional regulator
MSQIIKPNLSTVEQPSYEMGTAAFNLLLEEMQSRKDGLLFTPKSIELNTQIISRETT